MSWLSGKDKKLPQSARVAEGPPGPNAKPNLEVSPKDEKKKKKDRPWHFFSRKSGKRDRDQRFHASDASIGTPEGEIGTAKLEHERGIPSDTPNEQLNPNTPDLHLGTEGSSDQNGKGQGTAAELVGRDWKVTALGGTNIAFGVALGASEAFGPVKAALSVVRAIYDAYEGTVAVRNKISDLLARIDKLCVIFAARASDIEEQKRRDTLLREFQNIETQLQPLLKCSAALKFLNYAHDHEIVSGLLDELREVISDYKLVGTMEIYEHGRMLIKAAEANVLNTFLSARGAEHRQGGDRRGCLKGTRGTVLDEIELWTRDFKKPPVYWLNGLAGTGKSTIAQTIAERVFADGQLGASFFCSRDFEDRSDLRLIFPTLAVQLARRYTEFRSAFVPLVERDPGIAEESLSNQMKKLIVGPLQGLSIEMVIVIDALDECKDDESTSAILSVIGQFAYQLDGVKFFLTGRPESRIVEGFRLPSLQEKKDVFVLHEVERELIDNDIRLFLQKSFQDLSSTRGPENMPTDDEVDLLCEMAAGLFVYAVATVKFINHKHENLKTQLNRLLRSQEHSAYVGQAKFKPNVTLDSLYRSILEEAFGEGDWEDDLKVRSILGAVVLAANPLSSSAIAALLDLDDDSVYRRLSSVRSLLIFQEDNTTSPVRPFHKSFPDFIKDQTRCTDERFYVSPPTHHAGLLIGCLGLMRRELKKNMCHLQDAVINSDVDDLRDKIEKYIDPVVRYACESWHKHLVDGDPDRASAITDALRYLLEKKFLYWLEVLSVLGATRGAVDALEVAAKWLETQESPPLDLVNDCFRFVTGFFEIIHESAQHIYHSALPLSPKTSLVRRLYELPNPPLARIVHGLPDSWQSSIAAAKFPSSIDVAVWSPCSKFIAVVRGGRSNAEVEVLDAVTLGRSPPLDLGGLCGTQWVVFSPDTSLLTWCGGNPVKFISWDVKTGLRVSTILSEQRTPDHHLATYSTCGKMFGVSYQKGDTFSISIYNVRACELVASHQVHGKALHKIWAHGENIRFAATTPDPTTTIKTWEVGLTQTHPLTEVGSIRPPANAGHFSFHPTLPYLAFTTGNTVKVWNTQTSEFLLKSEFDEWLVRTSFSLDGRFLVCGTRGSEFYLWKESPNGYTLPQKLTSDIKGSELLISPCGRSIIAVGGSAIQLWRIADSFVPPVDPTPVSQKGEKNFIVEISPDKVLAVIAQLETVTVLELSSGKPRLIIDAGMRVHGVGVDESTVVVVGDSRIVAWELPVDCASDRRVNVSDSLRSIPFEHPFPTLAQRPSTSVSFDLRHAAIVEDTGPHLHLYDIQTGGRRASAPMGLGASPWFAPSGRQIWCTTDGDRREADLWEIVEETAENGESPTTELKHRGLFNHLPPGLPWRSPHHYDVTNSQWVLNSNGKRLLWLPPHWRSDGWNRMWGGRFLALLDRKLLDAVILELE